MHFYHGFALKDEEIFLEDYIDHSDFCISGFSYGAIKAFKAAQSATIRVDKLQLFSPAFFQNSTPKFKRLQLMGYKKNSTQYIEKFTENCFLPYEAQTVHYAQHELSELDELLNYEWQEQELKTLVARGTTIEVYLGSDDNISDAQSAYEFFLPFSTVTLIKGANHFLQGDNR